MKIYLGGPLKAEAWRAYLSSLEEQIKKMGISTWSPYKDAGLLTQKDKKNPAIVKSVLQQDLDAFFECDAALFLLDDHHAGTALELGYAFCLNKFNQKKIYIIGLVTHMDGITHVDSMSRYCCEEGGVLVSSVDDLKIVLARLKATLTSPQSNQ